MDDLFGDVPQPERPRPPERKPLTAADVREQMLVLIATVRDAQTMPFEPDELKKHVAMFPIMAQWLPEDEGNQLCFAFMQEIERLKKAA